METIITITVSAKDIAKRLSTVMPIVKEKGRISSFSCLTLISIGKEIRRIVANEIMLGIHSEDNELAETILVYLKRCGLVENTETV